VEETHMATNLKEMMSAADAAVPRITPAQAREMIGRWRDTLDQLLLANQTKAARERLTLIRVFDELRGRASARRSGTPLPPFQQTRISTRGPRDS
jgi:hypothetical protein